jgi:Flp pilus assembly secretin CpaC
MEPGKLLMLSPEESRAAQTIPVEALAPPLPPISTPVKAQPLPLAEFVSGERPRDGRRKSLFLKRHFLQALLPLAACLLSIRISAQQPAPAASDEGGPAMAPSEAPSSRAKASAEKAYLEGVRAMNRGDARTAERDFDRARRKDPSSPEYSMDWRIAHAYKITGLIREADRARIQGREDVAKARLKQALALDPKNPEVSQHLVDVRGGSDGMLRPSLFDERTASLAPPIALKPAPGKRSFHIKSVEIEVLRQVLQAYGLTPIIDDSVGLRQIRFDVDNVDYAHAAPLVELATDSFLTPLDPTHVLAARNTRDNHTRFDRLAMETLRLPGLTAAEMTDMGNIARNLIGAQQAVVQASAGTLTVRAPVQELTAINRTFSDLLDGRSEVLLDVRLYQIAQTRTTSVGVQLPQSVSAFNIPAELNSVLQNNQSLVQQIVSSGLANANDLTAIAGILLASGQVAGSVLGQPFAVFGNGLTLSGLAPGSLQANFSLNSSDTRALDEVQLRLQDNAEGTIRSGTRYPITTSSYSGLGAPSLNIPGITSTGLSSVLAGLGVNLSSLASQQQTIPQVQYQDLGLILTVTPRIERNDDVNLKFDFKIQSLQGEMLNGLPVLTNRSYTAEIGLHNGDSALLMGEMTKSEANAVSGLPGLSALPGFGGGTNSNLQVSTSNLLILVTPHILRRRNTEHMGPMIPLPRRG